MKRQEVKLMIDQICKKNSYYQFEDDTAVAPPFCCYYFPDDGFFFADNSNEVRIGIGIVQRDSVKCKNGLYEIVQSNGFDKG